MLRFCPNCRNLLFVEKIESIFCFNCHLCPYTYKIEKEIETTTYYAQKKKPVEIVSEEDRYRYAESTEIRCSKCGHNRAYFYMVQTRSADEPMTIVYRCCNRDCHYTWRD